MASSVRFPFPYPMDLLRFLSPRILIPAGAALLAGLATSGAARAQVSRQAPLDEAHPAISGQALIAPRGAATPGWEREDEILRHIHAPKFPDRSFPITDFGAVAGADSTAAIAQAIAACHAAGGGRVVVPAG